MSREGYAASGGSEEASRQRTMLDGDAPCPSEELEALGPARGDRTERAHEDGVLLCYEECQQLGPQADQFRGWRVDDEDAVLHPVTEGFELLGHLGPPTVVWDVVGHQVAAGVFSAHRIRIPT
jgi:hypothetical protein